MPRANSLGNAAMGAGGHQGSIDRVYLPDAYGPVWISDGDVVFPSVHGTLERYVYATGYRETVAPRGANSLYGSGSGNAQWPPAPPVWAAWLAGYGLFASTGLYLPAAGLIGVGPQGEIAYTPNYQNGVPCVVREQDGSEWLLSEGVVYDLQLLGHGRAIWTFNQNVYVRGLPPPQVVPGGVWGPRLCWVGDEWFLTYFSGALGVIAHRATDASQGWVIAGPGVNAYNHATCAMGSALRVLYASGAGELAHELMVLDLDPAITPMVPFAEAPAPVDPITPINRAMFLCFFTGGPGAPGGWDTNNDPPGTAVTPGNGKLDVLSATVVTTDGRKIATYVIGGSVEDIEAAARTTPYPAMAYWDDRRWPRLPNLPDGSWLCVQAYRRVEESVEAFEHDLRSILQQHIQARPTLKHVLVPQSYTSNAKLTKDLKSIVPVCSRLGASIPVYAMAPFSGSGRATGLQEYPDCRALWEQLFATVTGMPDEGGTVPTFTYDLTDLNNYAQRRWQELDAQARTDRAVANGADGEQLYDLQSSILVQIFGEYHHDYDHPEVELFYKNSGTCYSLPGYGCCSGDICVLRLASGVWWQDVGISFGGHRPSLSFSSPFAAAAPSDWSKCGPPPDPTSDPEPPDPPLPGEVTVLLMEYDTEVSRRDPHGLLMRFEAASPNPIVNVELSLNDGAPSIPIAFLEEVSRDGRYVRGLAWKPTITGMWFPTVTAKDSTGATGSATGTEPITVSINPVPSIKWKRSRAMTSPREKPDEKPDNELPDRDGPERPTHPIEEPDRPGRPGRPEPPDGPARPKG